MTFSCVIESILQAWLGTAASALEAIRFCVHEDSVDVLMRGHDRLGAKS